jgi:hypothetical protein
MSTVQSSIHELLFYKNIEHVFKKDGTMKGEEREGSKVE